jgi:hypothetical protein
MAIVTFHPLMRNVSKSLGRLTMSSWRGITYMTQKRKSVNPRTPRQQKNRLRFAELVCRWQALSASARSAWIHAAEGRPLSGYNLFIRENIRRQSAGLEVLEVPEIAEKSDPVSPGTSEGLEWW